MKFHVMRTSIYNEKHKPCENAKKCLVEFQTKNNTRTKEIWCIELNSLEELMSFIDQQNYEVIINTPETSGWGSRIPSIEIYDDYRGE